MKEVIQMADGKCCQYRSWLSTWASTGPWV